MSDSVKPAILLFLIIVAAGIIGGFLAADRGRRVAGWCLLCALFPPFLLFIYFARPLCEVEGIFRKCPTCGAMIRWRASTCKFCRSGTMGKNDGERSFVLGGMMLCVSLRGKVTSLTARTVVFLFAMLLNSSSGFAAAKLKSLCEIHFPSDTAIEWDCVKLSWKDTPEKLFGARWQDVLRFNRMDRRHFYGGMSLKVPKHLEDLVLFKPIPDFFPEAESDDKFILVNQSEMFLGAYEHGKLVFSFPAAVGIAGHRVPNGDFRVDAIDRRHISNMYTMEEIGRPYPMHYGLRFFMDKSLPTTPSYYIHGRDIPGYPASHGCIGIYDEEMQIEYYSSYDRKIYGSNYRELKPPLLEGAKKLYKWVVDGHDDSGTFHKIDYGPRMKIIGEPPL